MCGASALRLLTARVYTCRRKSDAGPNTENITSVEILHPSLFLAGRPLLGGYFIAEYIVTLEQ
jgi:hypothetical protein